MAGHFYVWPFLFPFLFNLQKEKMNKEQFTPGPWRAEWTHREGSQKFGWHITDEKNVEFCFDLDGTKWDEANANLIAAAPDMYHEMMGYVKFIESNDKRIRTSFYHTFKSVLNKANPK
jgi:hypothetical protein